MNRLKDYVLLFLKGISMGSADVVPGVSGGTIAFITGIYEELLQSIKQFDRKALKLLFRGQISALWNHVNGRFLVTLLSGIGVSIISLAKLIHYLLSHNPIQLWSFFFGLIIISAIMVSREIIKWNWKVAIAWILGIVVAYIITGATPANTPENYFFVFVSGAIAICAMILPGISGSFMLLIMGKYEFIIGAVKDMNIGVIVVFALGCVVGLLSFARIVSWLLSKYHDITVGVLAGFMIGSLNKIWPWKETLSYFTNSKGELVPLIQQNISPAVYLTKTGQNPMMLQALLFTALGILLVIAIEKIAKFRTGSK